MPEKELERHELEQVVLQALNRLAVEQRAVVLLVDLLDFDYKEAAQTLSVPIGTVKSLLARARLQLRNQLSDLDE
jgi:RNA polymerase sigma-70 factor (ECF subfamily)